MAQKLRKKQKEFVKNYLANGENGTQAVIESGYNVKNKRVATVIGSENLTKPDIIEAIEAKKRTIAESIPDELLTEVHLQGLQAIKTDGESVSIDFPTRHKYLETGYKLKGSFAPDKVDLGIDIKPSDINLKEIADRVEEELKQRKT